MGHKLTNLYRRYLLGTPETSLKGRNTLNALRAFTSKLSLVKNERAVLIILKIEKTLLLYKL